MNRKRIIILIFILSAFTYSFVTFLRIKTEKDLNIESLIKLEDMEKSIKKEKNNNMKYGNIDSKYVENLYFEKESEYFEEYIRNVFNKYRIVPNLYQSKINDKKLSEINLDYKINAVDFFKLIYDIEKGEKLVMIKSFTIKKERDFNLKINMKLGGFYK